VGLISHPKLGGIESYGEEDYKESWQEEGSEEGGEEGCEEKNSKESHQKSCCQEKTS
jgi:hypothetical protein